MTVSIGESAPKDLRAPPPGERRRTRVAVVERFALVAEAIGLTLSRAGTCSPIPVTLAPGSSTSDALHSVCRARADIAVLSLTRGGFWDPLTLVEELSRRGISLIVTGSAVDDRSAPLYLAAGALSACQHSTAAEVVDLVNREVDRRRDQAVRRPLVPRPRDGETPMHRVEKVEEDRRNLGRLAPMEARILGQLMLGHTADDIARLHVVSVATVRTQISRMLAKLQVNSQLSAVALAWQVGWTPDLAPQVA